MSASTIAHPEPGGQAGEGFAVAQVDQHQLSAADLTRGTRQVITKQSSPVIASMPYNIAWLAGMIDNAAVRPPAADTRIWAFSGSRLTTYAGEHGTIMGPWATTEETDTTTGTASGKVVMNAPILWNGGHNFGVWLRQR